mmetsp:Transcript_20472/g.31305  ORF Transcript_20472/g.31305 Transcript_20472/m.31305 type:complete len:506 (+) Transcript_20472:152-1669(+)
MKARAIVYEHIPFLAQLEEAYNMYKHRLPCHYVHLRHLVVVLYLACCGQVCCYFFFMRHASAYTDTAMNAVAFAANDRGMMNDNLEPSSFRILHIVTALSEKNDGSGHTIAGEDRLSELIVPVLQHCVESMLTKPGWEVDVYLVLGWSLKPERRKIIEDALPQRVGLEIWDDATPISYDVNDGRRDDQLSEILRALARQHRFVIKDKLDEYDFFSVWEDDMLVSSDHISNFLELTEMFKKLAKEAPKTSDPKAYHGELSETQLKRLIPGFVRVEVLLDPNQETFEAEGIEIDKNVSIDPSLCCGIPPSLKLLSNPPNKPEAEHLVMWETGIKGLGVREIYPFGWFALQNGPTNLHLTEKIASYWSGEDGAFGDEMRPSAGDPKMFGQQGGYMLTRDQVIYLQEEACKGGFLPPYGYPFVDDGLHMVNVEFWSGGYQHFGGNGAVVQGCNMQRVISLEPEKFSKQLLYHTANNKQKAIVKARQSNVNTVFRQLQTVKKAAIAKISR